MQKGKLEGCNVRIQSAFLNLEKVILIQGVRGTSRSWKRKGNKFSPKAL